MPSKTLGLVALALVVGGLHGGARADVSAHASITGLGYRLFDLRPADGIAPAISFDLDYSRALQHAVAIEGRVPNGEPLLRGQVWKELSWVAPFQFFPQEQRTVETPNAAASARMGGSLRAGSYDLVAEGHAHNTLDDPDFVSRFAASSVASDSSLISGNVRAFSLTPFTQVIWSAHATLDAATTLGKRGGRFEEASASVFMQVYDAARQPMDVFERTLSVPAYRPRHVSERWEIELGFVNADSAPSYGFINTGVHVAGNAFLPVPEPAAPWLMLCGLAVVGGALRRRAGQAARHAGETA